MGLPLFVLTALRSSHCDKQVATFSENTVYHMMKKRVLMVLMAMLFAGARASAQQGTVTGTVSDEAGTPLRGVSVVVKGTSTGTLTNNNGAYTIHATPGQVLQFKFIGTAPAERPVGSESVINVQLKRVAASLDAIVVTAASGMVSRIVSAVGALIRPPRS
jgi:hypothetical protein